MKPVTETVSHVMRPGKGAFDGVLLGTAVGDSIGLPREGLSARRAAKLFGGAPLGHRLLFGRGMVSDDTEHACMTAQALLASGGDADRFVRSLAWRLRAWLLGLPAGVGKATAQAVVKLWLGFPPRLSGVRSAGNGPAMRAAVIGVWAADDVERLAAEQGALVVALAACHGALHGPSRVMAREFAPVVRGRVSDPELLRGLETALACARAADPPDRFMEVLGARGQVSGWVSRTVPAAVYCWLRWPGDFRTAVEQVVLMGGDADTTGAIVGGLVGATVGAEAIPAEWVAGVFEWPRSVAWMRRLARRLEGDAGGANGAAASGPLPLFWPGLLARNLLFLVVVLVHGSRRLLPPY